MVIQWVSGKASMYLNVGLSASEPILLTLRQTASRTLRYHTTGPSLKYWRWTSGIERGWSLFQGHKINVWQLENWKFLLTPIADLTVCLLFCTELEAKERKRFLFISALLGLKLGTSVQCATVVIPGCLGWTGPSRGGHHGNRSAIYIHEELNGAGTSPEASWKYLHYHLEVWC